ncbi:penicillin-binding protein activator LpoB [Trichlorobacter lovleyi]|uniref:penicillin-binding protein activator LpoB n=1 Tax=Trichlorobacter lovleyi TaxID=313985 RepID=UPI00223F66AA|nr:penicillin-binding protein activator LpoB [Trichlorobacter lovleyi]QOX80178.1 penicillin-binding protein activator LpoB [Trichlorobacter lovleyi]
MKRVVPVLVGLMMLAGCTTLHQGMREAVPQAETWAVIPFVNNTETPFAAERAEAIATALLYARGIQRVVTAPQDPAADAEALPDRGLKRRQEGLAWAKKQNIRYALQGTITEWRYKVGLDGEPVAGMTLQLVDLRDDKVLWSGSSGKSGWSREAVSAVAQQVLENLIKTIELR